MGFKSSKERIKTRNTVKSTTVVPTSLVPHSTYQYSNLNAPDDTIRLLSLQPCDPSQPTQRLECKLEDVLLSDNPSFEALSYTWGDPNPTKTLACGNGELGITNNLHDALVRFRLPNCARKLWVDAVCINQSDNQEKSLQVPLMAKIYGQATSVLIWLGEETVGSNSVMEYLERIGQAFMGRGGPIREPRDDLRSLLEARGGWRGGVVGEKARNTKTSAPSKSDLNTVALLYNCRQRRSRPMRQPPSKQQVIQCKNGRVVVVLRGRPQNVARLGRKA
jgi:hypothetical protein